MGGGGGGVKDMKAQFKDSLKINTTFPKKMFRCFCAFSLWLKLNFKKSIWIQAKGIYCDFKINNKKIDLMTPLWFFFQWFVYLFVYLK